VAGRERKRGLYGVACFGEGSSVGVRCPDHEDEAIRAQVPLLQQRRSRLGLEVRDAGD
jgi:hypothetical protein